MHIFKKRDIRELTYIAITGTLAYILARFTKIPIFASAPFLKLDIGEFPLLLIAMNFNIQYGLIALTVKEILSLFISGSNILGLFADFILCGVTIIVFGCIQKTSINKFYFSIVIAALIRAIISVPTNFLVLKLQFGSEVADVLNNLAYILLFNILKPFINGLLANYVSPKVNKIMINSIQ